jgi:hypothetical protein
MAVDISPGDVASHTASRKGTVRDIGRRTQRHPRTTDLVAAAPGRKNKFRPSLLVGLLFFDQLPPFAC